MINYNYKQTKDYLTEQNFHEFLLDFLPNEKIIRDKKVPNSGINNRPDFRIDSLKLIIEFNGKFHYTNPNTILNDHKKTRVYEEMGYKVKSIPFWIQLIDVVIQELFYDVMDIDYVKLKDYNLYPLGFISKDCSLPATFCSLGILECNKEYQYWNGIIDKYYKYFDFTLIEKILDKDSFLSVANEDILPYFVSHWNMKQISCYQIDFDMFPNITKEIKILKKLKEFKRIY